MRKLTFFISACSVLFLNVGILFGQRRGDDAAACATCGTCGAGMGAMIIIPIVLVLLLIGLNIALLIWVARDAKARGLDNSVLWMALVFFTGVIGLIIYVLSRPQGDLVQCPFCGNKRLQSSAKCPTCGNS